MTKLTKKAQFCIIGAMVLIIVLVGFLFSPKDNKELIEDEKIIVVKESVDLKAIYLDSISKENGSDLYSECKVVVKQGEDIAGYKITNTQEFSKYIQLTGPDGKEVLTSQSQEVITHHAYSCLLTGDIIEKKVGDTKTYEIVNARVTYERIPFALLEMENKACIRNKNKNKVKIMNLKEFTEALGNIDQRKEIINW